MGEEKDQKQFHLVIADTAQQFLPYTEEEIIRRYADHMTVQMLTNKKAVHAFFEETKSINVLVIDKGSYGDFLQDHTINHVFVLAPEVEAEETMPDNTEILMGYIPVAEIFLRIEETLQEDGILEKEVREEEQQRNTRVIAVYSPIGGCGKSLISYALARKLRKLDQKVLLVACDPMQSAGVYFPAETYAKEKLAEKLIHPDGETYWTILQNIEQSEISYLLPFEKTLPSLEIGMQQWEVLLTVLCEKRDFDYIVLDIGTVLGRQTASLLSKVDFLILLTETNLIANRKMQKLLQDSDLLPKCECFLVANEYKADGMRIASESVFGTITPYNTWEEVLEDPVFYQIALKVIE
ncbi:MAG: AAA family ATPase [Eubacterium sp.]|nr:AAA family ATPase [Eubacterium sp.]